MHKNLFLGLHSAENGLHPFRYRAIWQLDVCRTGYWLAGISISTCIQEPEYFVEHDCPEGRFLLALRRNVQDEFAKTLLWEPIWEIIGRLGRVRGRFTCFVHDAPP